MTITANPVISLAVLLEWLISSRVDKLSWVQAGSPYTNCWYRTFSAGTPAEVTEDGVKYSSQVALADCHSTASSFYYDSAVGILYLHTSGTNNPSNYFVVVRFWEYFASHPVVFNGHYYEPRVKADSIPSVTMEITAVHEGGSRQAFGVISLINSDGYFDARLDTYNYEAGRMRFLASDVVILNNSVVWPVYSAFDCFWECWSGNIECDVGEIRVSTEDFRRVMV